ncbi:MAG: hypothetical protein PHF00_06935, partial [Elusimicrobia bacterium]|nr:hypothetical protein [Elusimicrobiota bacterium]
MIKLALVFGLAGLCGAGDFAPALPEPLRRDLAVLKSGAGRAPEPAAAALPECDPNVPAAVKEQMARDLDFAGSIQAEQASRLHREVFGSVDGPAYLRWFASRIKAVGFDEAESDPTTMAYVLIGHRPWKMWLTRNFVAYSQPQIARVMDMFHEARHTEPDHGHWRHVVCPTPFLDQDGREVRGILSGRPMAGKAACDREAVGAYGIEVVMQRNIFKYCRTCGGKVRLDADLYAGDSLKRIIDPWARREIMNDL